MENPLFEPRLPLFLAGFFLLFWLVGLIGMWLRLVGDPSMTKGFFISLWVVIAALVSFFALPLYGAAEIPPVAISAALSLAFVYLATRIAKGTPRGWRAIALAGGVAILATLIFPLCLLITTAAFGIDGPQFLPENAGYEIELTLECKAAKDRQRDGKFRLSSSIRNLCLASLAAVIILLLVVCTRKSYVYVSLAGSNVEVAESGDPPRGSGCVCGAPIPVRYVLTEPGVSITISLGDEQYVPSFEITSSVAIRAVSVGTTGWAIPRSPFAYKVFWSYWRGDNRGSPRVGDIVEITIELEDRTEPLLVSGVITEYGKSH